MILQTKKKLFYLLILIIFFSVTLLGKELFFTPAFGSSSGTVTATVTVNPLKVDVSARPHSPIADKKFKLQATIKNLGSTTLNDAEATIFLPAGLTPLSDESQFLGSIDGGRKKRASWTIQADEAGNYIIIIAVSAIDNGSGNTVSNEASITVEVSDKPKKGLAAVWNLFLNIFR